ncbi:MAG: hypothetical protein K1X28_05770 [Parachlamydiales bacterium]|nr:hypothetical protein [Parachlamydiales bacterium]
MSSVSLSSSPVSNGIAADPVTTVQNDLLKLISDLQNGVNPVNDYKQFAQDATALIQTGGVSPAFKQSIEKMLANGNDLSSYVERGYGDVNAAIGQATALMDQLSGTNSLTDVNEDLEQLQEDFQHDASSLNQDYKKLLQDGYALKDEGAAPIQFLQSFDNMIQNGNDLSSYVERGSGDINAAIGQATALMDQLSGTNSMTDVNQDLEQLQEDFQHGAFSSLQQDYQKLLQDGYALKDEGAAPMQFLQAFDAMTSQGNALSEYVATGSGSVSAAEAVVTNFMNLLA